MNFTKHQQILDLLAADKIEQAEAAARRLVAKSPTDPAALEVMRHVLADKGQADQALHFARRAAAAAPGDLDQQHVLVTHLALFGEVAEALSIARRLTEACPGHADYWAQLCSVLDMARDHADLERTARLGLAAAPGDVRLLVRLASALINLGQVGDALAIYDQLMLSGSNQLELAQEVASFINYIYPPQPARVLATAKNYARLLGLKDFRQPTLYIAPRALAKAPLRVGFVSSDLRDHSVAFFVRPLLDHLDPALITPVGYMTQFHIDAVTDEIARTLKRLGGVMRKTVGMTDAAVAKLVIADRIDILIDLNGLTAGQRMDVLRLKPAPIQMTWCGYPATTGLDAIDYRIVDSITDPPPPHPADQWAVERLVRLDPCFLCYSLPHADSLPPLAPPPMTLPGARGTTFGSFNAIMKVNDGVIGLWTQVLRAVPGSTLLVKGITLKSESARQALLDRFMAAGCEPGQVQLMPPPERRTEHLALYNRVDVALDTFPYNGTTTTCEALLMGVPTITLAPPQGMHASRVGASLLAAIGLPDFVAADEQEFVRIAARTASDPAGLTTLRQGLREQLQRSTLCDGKSFARRFTAMLQSRWANRTMDARK